MGSVEALLVFAQSALETASSIAETQRPSVLPDPDRQWLKDKLRSVSCFFSPPDPVIIVKRLSHLISLYPFHLIISVSSS